MIFKRGVWRIDGRLHCIAYLSLGWDVLICFQLGNVELYTTTLQCRVVSLSGIRKGIVATSASSHAVANQTPALFDRDNIHDRRLVPLNGKTSGNGHGHLDHQTSLARNVCCRQRAEYGRTRREPASAGSCCAHRCTFGSRQSTLLCQFSHAPCMLRGMLFLSLDPVDAAAECLLAEARWDIRCSWR